jgi:predicted lipoprotein
MSGGEGKKTDTGRIPRKPKGNGNKGDEQKRHCNLCAQFGGNHSTHNTSVCRRWTKEGKQQAGWKQQRPNGNGKRDFAASLEKQEKEIHALKKLLKKKHKKRKRAYQYASDSSSDEESK